MAGLIPKEELPSAQDSNEGTESKPFDPAAYVAEMKRLAERVVALEAENRKLEEQVYILNDVKARMGMEVALSNGAVDVRYSLMHDVRTMDVMLSVAIAPRMAQSRLAPRDLQGVLQDKADYVRHVAMEIADNIMGDLAQQMRVSPASREIGEAIRLRIHEQKRKDAERAQMLKSATHAMLLSQTPKRVGGFPAKLTDEEIEQLRSIPRWMDGLGV